MPLAGHNKIEILHKVVPVFETQYMYFLMKEAGLAESDFDLLFTSSIFIHVRMIFI